MTHRPARFDRCLFAPATRIIAGLAEGLAFAEIGWRLGQPASTVMREVARNGGSDDYAAQRAQEATKHRARRERYVVDDGLWVRSTLAALQMN